MVTTFMVTPPPIHHKPNEIRQCKARPGIMIQCVASTHTQS